MDPAIHLGSVFSISQTSTSKETSHALKTATISLFYYMAHGPHTLSLHCSVAALDSSHGNALCLPNIPLQISCFSGFCHFPFIQLSHKILLFRSPSLLLKLSFISFPFSHLAFLLSIFSRDMHSLMLAMNETKPDLTIWLGLGKMHRVLICQYFDCQLPFKCFAFNLSICTK